MEFFGDTADLVRAAAESDRGLLALLIIIVATIGLKFFKNNSTRVKLIVWLTMVLGASLFGFAMITVRQSPTREPVVREIAPADSASTSTPGPSHPGFVEFFEGNGGTQSRIGSRLPVWPGQSLDLSHLNGWTNDEIRSLILYDVRVGARIRLYNASDARESDDWVEIVVNKLSPKIVVTTLEQNMNTPEMTMTYHDDGKLDGKVSLIRID